MGKYKFGDFSQNAMFLNLADFKFGTSVTQPKGRDCGGSFFILAFF